MTTNLIQSAFLHILFSKRQRISTKFCMYKINTKVQIMHINTISLKKFSAFQNCPYCLFLNLSFITTRVTFKIHKNLEVYERIQIYFCFQYQLFLRVKDNSKNFKNKKTYFCLAKFSVNGPFFVQNLVQIYLIFYDSN